MIETKGLCVGYGDKRVLEDISLRFEPGCLTAVIGPNGCGKSSLLRTLLLLQDSLAGEIFIDGVSALELSPKARAQKLTYMAQSRATPNISAKSMVLHGRFPYLGYPRRYRREDHAAAMTALERVGATDLAEQYLPELSGGQRQKVYLAMALAQDTQTVFMDEPTTYLDAQHQLHVMRVARQLAEEGKAVIMVVHDLCMAMRAADRIILLSQGRVIADGDAESVYKAGVIDEAFNISLRRVQTENGWQYYYDVKTPQSGERGTE